MTTKTPKPTIYSNPADPENPRNPKRGSKAWEIMTLAKMDYTLCDTEGCEELVDECCFQNIRLSDRTISPDDLGDTRCHICAAQMGRCVRCGAEVEAVADPSEVKGWICCDDCE